MKWLIYGTMFTVFGAIMMFALTMLGTTVYAWVVYDMDAWSNVINWLHPRDNLLVRIVSLVGTVMAYVGGWIIYAIDG